MTSFVTVWTSPSTANVESRVARLIRASRDAGEACDSISIAGHDTPKCIELLNQAFRQLVSLSMSDSTLHIVAVIPLYEADALQQLKTLCNACSALEHSITLHILGLSNGMQQILDAKSDQKNDSGNSAQIADKLGELCKSATFSMSYSLIDDYVENGAPIRFTVDSLARYIALIQTAMMQDYYKIISPSLITAHAGDNLSVGVASLSFDRDAAATQMLGLGFIEALDNAGINNKEVDAQKAAREAESILAGISSRYPKLFEKSVRPLYKEEGMDEGRVAAKAAFILDDEIKAIKDEILSLLRSDELSLPEKEAVLALVLGRDNENIRGMQYEHEGALLDDACEEPINLYIEAFNRCCKDSHLLPLRGDFKALKKSVWNEEKKKFEESPENKEALNPLPDIKRLKQEIINLTSFIRDKQDELDKLQKSERQRQDVEVIRRKWQKPKGDLKEIQYKEQPLDQQYTPAPGLEIKNSVDLRKFFTPAKNQRDLGSCTSFAAVAMYEAMMSRAGVESHPDMSPAYLYYYSNILKGRPSGGSNFYEQLEVLGTHGVCREDLYVYDSDSPETKPSEKADEDASHHRVIAARQIPILDEADKSETLKRNHRMLTSALSEGFPIGISLKVYNNLGRSGAFILHPDDAPDAAEEGWHAMVIVGYSEENNFYIVRNSWGPEFGEDGYCYIPTAYIDDPDYLAFACIITEISDMSEGGQSDIPTVIADFAATESEIRTAAIRNAIAKVRVDLKNSQKLYAEYYKYYQRLIIQLTIPKTQNNIRSTAELAQTFNYINADDYKQKLEDSFVGKIKQHKKNLLYTIASLSLLTIALGLGWWYNRDSLLLFILFVISAVICGLTIFGYKWWKRLKRRHLQEDLDRVAVEAKRQADQLFEMQIRFHVAGMWINRFHNLSMEIGNVYDRLVSYNSSLRQWRNDYSRQIGALELPEGQMFRVLDATNLLQGFFNQNKSAIVSEVDFIKLFENYQINPEELDNYHRNLHNAVKNVIDSLMKDFNIANFLLGDRYMYLENVSLQNEISALIKVGRPSYRNPAINAMPPIYILICNVQHERENQWISEINPLFPMLPMRINSDDPTSMILLTIHPQRSSGN